ncbi:MAG TPA: DUF6569 family protein [Actinomycetota bacterium]
MTPTNDPIDLVRTLFAGELRLGAPHTVGGLTLLPVIGGAPAPAYRTAARAIAEGTLVIGELDGGSVPQLVVRNTGPLPVLLLDGEHLEGAMQNRVLNVTVLAAARHDTVIPVSCVERGRWGYAGPRPDFAPSTDHAYAELRAMNAGIVAENTRAGRGRRTDQDVVWAEIERKRTAMGAGHSPTGSLRDAFEDRRDDLERIRHAFVAPGPAQTGVLAAAGGHVLALDVFDHAQTLALVWDRLVRGYAADALTAAPASSDGDAAAATAFWAELGHPDNEVSAHEGVGLGVDVLVTSPGTVANALTWEGAAVHMAAFPRGRAGRPSPTRPRRRDERIERPSVRARNRRAGWFHEERSDDGR